MRAIKKYILRKGLIVLIFMIVSVASWSAVNLIQTGVAIPNLMYRGISYQISVTVKNSGTTSTSTTFPVNISINTVSTYGGQTYLTDIIFTGGLAAGASRTLSTTITIPCTYSTGTRYILVGINPAPRAVIESDYTDNDFGYSMLLQTAPDLVPLNYSLSSSSITAGNTLTANFAVNNLGGTAAGAFTAGFYLSNSTTLNVGSATFLGNQAISSISACAQTTLLAKSLTIPTTICTGTYYLFMWVDNGLAINEVDNNNNYQYIAILVNGVSFPTAPITTFGDASNPSLFPTSLTPTLTWTGTGSNYWIQISKCPYGSANIVYSIDCVSGNSFTIPSGNLLAGRLYRWNMYAGNACCVSGQSALSNTRYFSIPPEIVANGSTTICSGGVVQLQTDFYLDATYQWKRNGVNINGANSYNYSANQTGNYSVTLTYSACGISIESSAFVVSASTCCIPTNQASNIIFQNNTGLSVDVSWNSNAGGTSRLVKINSTNNFSDPINGNSPSTVNNNYSGSGEQVVYFNIGNNVTVTGLTPNQTYYFRVYEANCTGSQIIYNTSSSIGNPAQVTMVNGLSPIADFTTPNGVIVAGQTTQIFNTSSNAINFSWAIHRQVWNGVFQLVYTSTLQNASFDFPQAACYRVTLTAYNGSNSDTKVSQCFIYAKPNLNAPIPPDVTRAQEYYTYHGGDPVNLTNGSFSFAMRDISISGTKTNTVLERRYFSNSGYESVFGVGWHHSFDIKVTTIDLWHWFVQYPDGHNEHFVPYANGATKSMYPGNFDSLSYVASGALISSFTLWKKDGTQWLFNSSGQIVSIIDLNGNQTEFNYTLGRLSSVISPGGRTLHFTYNAANKVSTITDNTGRSVFYFYNGTGYLDSTRIGSSTTSFRYGPYGITEIYDPRGNRILQNIYNVQSQVIEQYDVENQKTTFQYDTPIPFATTVTDPTLHSKVVKHDTRARCTEVLNEAGFTEKYAYSLSNTLDTITNALGYKNVIDHDERGNSIRTTDANGFSDSIGYNSLNKPTSLRDKENNIYQTLYSSSGNPTHIISPNGDTIKYEYDSRGLDTAIIDSRGFRTRKIYNSFGDLAQLITPSSQTTFSYDAVGRLIETTDSYGRKDSIFWNYFDLPTKRKDKMGFVEEFEYDRNGNLILYRDKEGNVTNTEYNKFDKPVRMVNPLNHVTEIVYDQLQRPIKYRDANKNVTITDYDPIGQEIQVRDSVLGVLSMNMRDQVGNILYKSDGLGNIWERRYDPGGRVSFMVNPIGDSIKYKYNKVNNVTEIIDEEGKSVKWEYDALSRHFKTIDALNNHVQIYYNKTGQIDSVRDARGNVRNKALYDGSGRLLSLNDGFGAHTMDWDSTGNVRTIIDPDGRGTNYLYNGNSELIGVTGATSALRTYILNNNGQYLQANSATQNSSVLRNSAGWITQYTDNFSNTTSHVYDSLGLIKKIIYPGGKAAEYRYNSLNKCIEVKDWYNRIYTINRDKNGGITSIVYPNNFSTVISRDMAYRVKAWINADDTGGVFQSNLLKLSKAGNVERDSGTHVLPFIPLPVAAAGVYGPDDRMLSYGETTISSNHSGQRIEKAGPADNVSYRWSPMSELDTINQNGVVSIQKYDAFNERTIKEHAGVETRFVVDHGVAEFPITLQERDGLNTELINYLFVPGDGILLGRDSVDAFRFYHHNLFGNTVALSDLSGTITDRYEYSALTDTFYHGGPSNQSATWMGMYGVQYDGDGLYYVHARYYDGKTGTFISRDPNPVNYRNTQDIDRYVYGYNNALAFSDPTGLSANNNISYDGLNRFQRFAISNAGIKTASFLTGLLKVYHLGLDVLGLIPGFGEPADFYNGILYGIQGDRNSSLLSFAATIPGIGNLATVGKYFNRTGDVVKGGSYLVYKGFDKEGLLKYVGITSRDAPIRFGEHLSSNSMKSFLIYDVIPGANNLSKIDAKILEQTIINQNGLSTKGGQLLNKINSIAPKYWSQYGIK